MSSRDIRIYGVRQIDDYVPEDRPNQEDLFHDEDGDRLLWQLQLNRREAAEAWKTGARPTHEIPGGLVPLPDCSMQGLYGDWESDIEEPRPSTEGGDS